MKSRPSRRKGRINWQQVRQRLDRALAATEGALRLSPEQARAVLEQRAHALARVPAQAMQATDGLEVVTFSLANERYAVATEHVREIVRFSDYTPIPGAPDFLVGIINLRGEILAVVDLRKFFGVAGRGLTDLSRVIVLGRDRPELGILGDAVHEVTRLRLDEVHEPPPTVAGIGRDYLRGVTAEALIVLDGAVLLQDHRLFLDEAD